MLTPLEQEILQRYYLAYGDMGFPEPSQIEVVERENTGAGRFVTLKSPIVTRIADRVCDLPEGVLVRMEGLEQGLGFTIFMERGAPDTLELFTFDDGWDGVERAWEIVTAPGAERKGA